MSRATLVRGAALCAVGLLSSFALAQTPVARPKVGGAGISAQPVATARPPGPGGLVLDRVEVSDATIGKQLSPSRVVNLVSALANMAPAVRSDGPVIPEPAGYGHYCSVRYPSGGWAFAALSNAGSDPCGDLRRDAKADNLPIIERAGLWHLSGNNNAVARCGGETFVFRGVGRKAIDDVFAAAKNKQGCVIIVSAAKLPIFVKPYGKTNANQTDPDNDVSHYRGFDFAVYGKRFEPRMFGASGADPSNTITRIGNARSEVNDHWGHDWPMPKGKPLRAVAAGKVLLARERDTRPYANGDQNHVCWTKSPQPEVYLLHVVGTGEYQERFVSYYAHMDTTSVRTNGDVASGASIGTAGDRGCSGGPHLHFGAVRLRNVTAGRLVDMRFEEGGSGHNAQAQGIDPFGWAAPQHIDPLGWAYFGEHGGQRDPGAFSLDLWKDNEAPPYRQGW